MLNAIVSYSFILLSYYKPYQGIPINGYPRRIRTFSSISKAACV